MLVSTLLSVTEPIVYGAGPHLHYDLDSIGSWLSCVLLLPFLLHLLYYYDTLSPLRVKGIQRRFFRRALYLSLGHFAILPLLKTTLLLSEPVHTLFLEHCLLCLYSLVTILWLQYQLSQPKSGFQKISVFQSSLPTHKDE